MVNGVCPGRPVDQFHILAVHPCQRPRFYQEARGCRFLGKYAWTPNNLYLYLQDLLELIDPVQLCPDCEIVRTPRSRHCSICNKCVERFDHHCPWTDNCVGINNHSYFMVFITALQITLVGIMAITGYECGRYYTDGLGEELMYTVLPESAYRSQAVF